jgi:cell division protein FtsB
MAARAQRFLNSRARRLVTALLVAVSVYLLAWTPAHTWMDQRRQLDQAEERYAKLSNANGQLDQRIQQLQTDQEIERLARERYELVKPGQQAYSVMPSTATTTPPPTKHDEGSWSKVWDKLSFWN